MRIDGEVVNDEDDQITDRNKGDDAGVFKRIETAEEAERDDEEHEGCDPKVSVDQIGYCIGVLIKAQHDTGHEISDNDHVGDADAKALDGDGQVEDDGGVGVG